MTARDNQNTSEWLSVIEVADHLRVTRRTVDRYIRDGHLAATRLPGGRLLRIRRSDLDALLTAGPLSGVEASA